MRNRIAILALTALAPAAPAAAAPAAPDSFLVRESPTELRLETARSPLTSPRDGFAWTLPRDSQVTLQSAPPAGPSANGALLFPDGPELPTKLKSIERVGDRVVLEYEAKRKK